MTPYRIMLAAVPAEPKARCTVLVLEPWQDLELEQFLEHLLTQDQRLELDRAVFMNLADVLETEILTEQKET